MQTSLSEKLPLPRRRLPSAFASEAEVLNPSLPMSDLLSAPPLSGRTGAEGVECPKCSKRSIIRRSPNTFDCLSCNFHKELPPVTMSAAAIRQLTYTQLPTVRPSLNDLDGFSEADKVQPLVFAVIAVIIGIIVL